MKSLGWSVFIHQSLERHGVGLLVGDGLCGASNDTYSGLNLRLHIAMIIAVLFLGKKTEKHTRNLMLLL